MSYTFSREHMAEALGRAHLHWQERHSGDSMSGAMVAPAFTVAVSREAGTYGAAIAREVGNRLGWPVYDRELLQRIAEDMGIRQTLLESVDERNVGWLRECFSKLFSVPNVNESVYFRRLVETLLSLATHGNCVVVGRGATAALPLATTLRVRVVAPREHRIEAIRREHSISHEEATRRLETTDRERNTFVKSHFEIDPSDAANYDLVVNAARFSTTECADLVIAAVERLRKQARSGLPVSSLPAIGAV